MQFRSSAAARPVFAALVRSAIPSVAAGLPAAESAPEGPVARSFSTRSGSLECAAVEDAPVPEYPAGRVAATTSRSSERYRRCLFELSAFEIRA